MGIDSSKLNVIVEGMAKIQRKAKFHLKLMFNYLNWSKRSACIAVGLSDYKVIFIIA